MQFMDKHIVIAGGSSGIGFGIAQQAVTQGARVTLIGRSANKLGAAAEKLSGQVSTLAFDVGDAASAARGFATLDPFDHFVSTAADLTYGPLATMDAAAIERTLASKLWGPIHLVQHGLPKLRPGGSILLFSGLAADRPGPGTSIVAAANSAVEGLVRALAVELAPVRVNAISPGVVQTEGWAFMEPAAREAFFNDLAPRLPARRLGTPQDLAAAALFVLGNPFLTGEVLHVNGGGALA